MVGIPPDPKPPFAIPGDTDRTGIGTVEVAGGGDLPGFFSLHGRAVRVSFFGGDAQVRAPAADPERFVRDVSFAPVPFPANDTSKTHLLARKRRNPPGSVV